MLQSDPIPCIYTTTSTIGEQGPVCFQASGDSLERVRRSCGHWLTWKRIQARLSCRFVAAWLDVTLQVLLLLEAGRADPSLISPSACRELSQILADDRYTPEQVLGILHAALGASTALPPALYEHIQHDLQRVPLSAAC